MKTLYTLAVVSLMVFQCQAALVDELAAAQDNIANVRQNIDSDIFLANSKCGKCGGSCGQACGQRNN